MRENISFSDLDATIEVVIVCLVHIRLLTYPSHLRGPEALTDNDVVPVHSMKVIHDLVMRTVHHHGGENAVQVFTRSDPV